MTWKAYSAVSGATVLAGWLGLASTPPSNAPEGRVTALRDASSPGAGTSLDIEREAMRLQARVRREVAYAEPRRNLFRFGAARAIGRPMVEPPTDAAPAQPSMRAVPPPALSLAGIAEDQVEQRVERTAILSSPDGVLLVREGDDVLGQYRVEAIEGEAVALVRHLDGTTLRLGLRP